MKFIVTITARMKSKRLPLKVMRYIKGKPMIEHQIDRIKLAKLPSKVVMCTSINPQDNVLIDVAEKKKIPWIRGSKKDVLKRLYRAAEKHSADYVISVTADNPLVDEKYIDKMIETFKKTKADYISCMHLPLGVYPFGFKVKALEKVLNSKDENDTECWGKFFEENKKFKIIEMEVEPEMNHPELRLTVDYPQDLDLIKKIFDKFYVDKNNFEIKKVIEYLLKNKDIRKINAGIKRGKHQVVKD